MNKEISALFFAFFIVVTGTVNMLTVSEVSPSWFAVIYGLSVVFSAAFLILIAIERRLKETK